MREKSVVRIKPCLYKYADQFSTYFLLNVFSYFIIIIFRVSDIQTQRKLGVFVRIVKYFSLYSLFTKALPNVWRRTCRTCELNGFMEVRKSENKWWTYRKLLREGRWWKKRGDYEQPDDTYHLFLTLLYPADLIWIKDKNVVGKRHTRLYLNKFS